MRDLGKSIGLFFLFLYFCICVDERDSCACSLSLSLSLSLCIEREGGRGEMILIASCTNGRASDVIFDDKKLILYYNIPGQKPACVTAKTFP